jgi:hypothetical protein
MTYLALQEIDDGGNAATWGTTSPTGNTSRRRHRQLTRNSLKAAHFLDPERGRGKPFRRSCNVLDWQPGAPPGDEATCNLRGAVAQCRLRSHGVLAEVDRPLALGPEDVASQRYRNRPRRSAVAAALELRPEVQQARVSLLQKRPHLLRVE